MARSCDDPGLVIREPIGDCLLQAFNYYVDDDYRLESLTNISRYDVVRFYRSIFPQKRDKDPTLYESAIAELVKERHPKVIWNETKHVLRTFVHLTLIKLAEDSALQQLLVHKLKNDQNGDSTVAEFFKSVATFTSTVQVESTWDMLYCEKCMEETQKFHSPPKRLKRNLSIKDLCGSPLFKRQQEKTQQVKRVLELENEIDEKNFSIESKEKEIEALSELLKEAQQKENERRKTNDDLADELAALRAQKDKFEQEGVSYLARLENANKRLKRELEETENRAYDSAAAEFQDRISGFERQIREVERKERDALRKLNERDALYNELKIEAKICSETAEQSAETIQQLEQELALAKQRLREQEEDLQEMRVFSAAPPANPGTPLSKYLEKDLRSQLEDAKKSIDNFRADVAVNKETISALEKDSFEAKAALSRAEDEVESLKTRNHSLSTKTAELGREVSQSRVKGQVLEEENSTFRQRIEALTEEAQKMKNAEILSSFKKEELEKEFHALESKSAADSAAMEASIAEMRAEKSDLDEEISSLSTELEEANAKWSSEFERRADLTKTLTEKERRLGEAESRVTLLEESLLSSKKELQSAADQFRADESKYKEREETRTAELQTARAKIAKTQTDLSQSKKELGDAKTALVDASATAARLEGDLATKEHELKNYEHAVRVQVDRVEAAEKKLAEAVREAGMREDEAAAKIGELEGNLTAVTEEKAAEAEAAERRSTLAEEMSLALQRELGESERLRVEAESAAEARVEALNAAAAAAAEESKRLVDGKEAESVASKRAHEEAMEAASAAAEAEVERLRVERSDFEINLEKEKEETVRLHAEEVSRARREIDDLTRDLGEWRNRFGGGDAAETEARMTRLTGDLKDAEKARVDAESAREAASAEMTAEIQRLDSDHRKAAEALRKELDAKSEEAANLDQLRLGEKVAAERDSDELRERVAALVSEADAELIARREAEALAARETEALQEAVRDSRRIVEAKESEIQSLAVKLEAAESEAIAKRTEIDLLERRVSEDTANAEKETAKLLRRHSDQVSSMVSEIDRLTLDATTLEASLQRMKEESESLAGAHRIALDDLRKELCEKSGQVADLNVLRQQEKEAAESATNELLERLASLDQNLVEAKEELATKDVESAAAAQNAGILETEMTALKTAVEDSRRLVETKEAEIADSKSEADEERAKASAGREEIARLNLEAVRAKADAEKEMEECRRLHAAEVTNMRRETDRLALDSTTSLEAASARMEEEMEKLASDHREATETLRNELGAKSEEIARLSDIRQRENETARGAADGLREKLADAELRLAAAEEEGRTLRVASEAAAVDAEATERELDALKREVASLKDQSATLTALFQKESDESRAAAEESSALKEKLEAAESRLEAATTGAVEAEERSRRELEAWKAEAEARLEAATTGAVEAEERSRRELEAWKAEAEARLEAATTGAVEAEEKLKREAEELKSEAQARLEAATTGAVETEKRLRRESEAWKSEAEAWKAEAEALREAGSAGDKNAADAKKDSEARLAKAEAEMEEGKRRLMDDFAVEKELMQETNTRMLLNLEKDKKKLEKKLSDLTKSNGEYKKTMEDESAQLKERLEVIEGEKAELQKRVDDLMVENEALMWGGSEKENSPEVKGRTFVKDESVAGDTYSLRSQVSSSSLSGQPPQPRLSSSRKNSQVDLKSQKSSSSLQSSSNFAAVNELEEDFLGTPMTLMEEDGTKRRETMAFGEAFKEQLLSEEDDDERRRLAELKRRNTLYPSHLQSSYPVETTHCVRKINESTMQRGQDTPTTRAKGKTSKTSLQQERRAEVEAPVTKKPQPVVMEFSPPGRANAGNATRRESLAQATDILQFSPGPLQGKRGPRRVPRRLGAFSNKSDHEPSPVAEVRPMSSSVNTATVSKSFKPFQRAKPDEDMFEIIKEATGHRIEDQVYDKPIPTFETPQPEAPPRPSPPSKALQKRKKPDDALNRENVETSVAGPTPTKRTKKGLTGTPMKMLSNLKINTPKTKLKLMKGNGDKVASSSGPHLRQEASALARSQESLNSLGTPAATPSAADRTSQSLNSLNSLEETGSLKKGFSLRRKGSSASNASRASASSQSSEDEGKKKSKGKSMRRSIMAIMK